MSTATLDAPKTKNLSDYITIEKENGVATVWLDQKGEKINKERQIGAHGKLAAFLFAFGVNLRQIKSNQAHTKNNRS